MRPSLLVFLLLSSLACSPKTAPLTTRIDPINVRIVEVLVYDAVSGFPVRAKVTARGRDDQDQVIEGWAVQFMVEGGAIYLHVVADGYAPQQRFAAPGVHRFRLYRLYYVN